MLNRAGLATPSLDVIRDIYSDSTTRAKTDKRLTTPINITQGVKQGCPLSPIQIYKVGWTFILHSQMCLPNLCQQRTSTSKRKKIPSCSLDDFLNTEAQAGEGKTGDIRNLWSLCRTSLKKTNTQLHPPSEHDQMWLEVSDTTRITDTKKLHQPYAPNNINAL